MPITWNIEVFDNLQSTQAHLKEQITRTANLAEGAVISAITQSSGLGRHGREWQSPTGNLYVSFLVKPTCHISETGQISLLSGLSILEAIQDNLDTKPILKWPNDILINTEKCCGIIIDAVEIEGDIVKSLVIGFGLNVKDAPLESSTCLAMHSSYKFNIEDILNRILSQFSNNYVLWQQEGFEPLRRKWINNAHSKGTKVSVKINNDFVSGAFEDIDTLGNMIIFCDKTKKQRKITSGDVFLL